MSLKISISGVRGFVPENLTPEICLDFAKAFGTFLGGNARIVVGTDSRQTSEYIKGIVFAGLLSTGCAVIDIGIAPTPTVGFMVRKLRADGGIIITASHNPLPWNGIKFVRHDGIFLNEKQAKQLIHIYEQKKFLQHPPQSVTHNASAIDLHIQRALSVIKLPREKFTVAIDACNGAGSVAAVKLLRKIGCRVIALNCDPQKPFPHPPEPIKENLSDLMRVVKEKHADIGFALDSDADRLAIVSGAGEAIGEELTLVLGTKYLLSKHPGQKLTVVTNLSTTQALDDVVEESGGRVIRTKIGEVHVAEEIKKQKALIGGEGNGGIIFPAVTFNRDSLSGMLMILNLMADSKKSLQQLAREIPLYHSVKRKIDCASQAEADAIIQRVKKSFKGYKQVLTEGVKILLPDGWIHVRASNTEPIVRVMGEGKDEQEINRLIGQILDARD